MIRSIESIEFFCLLGLSLLLWAVLISKWVRNQSLPIPKCSEGDWPRVGLVDVFVLLFLWMGGQMLGQMLAFNLTSLTAESFANKSATPDQLSTLMLWVKSSELLAISTGLCYLILRYRNALIRLFYFRWQYHLGLGLLAALLLIPPILGMHMLLAMLVPYEHTTLETIREKSGVFNLAVAWFTAVLVAPVSEEILCRAGIQSWIRRLRNDTDLGEMNSFISGGENRLAPEKQIVSVESKTGLSKMSVVAMLITSAFFAFLHAGQGFAFVPLFFLALGLGYIFERTRSILPCIVVHFVLNAHSMFWETLKTLSTQ